MEDDADDRNGKGYGWAGVGEVTVLPDSYYGAKAGHGWGQPKPQDLASTAKWSTEVDSDGLINE